MSIKDILSARIKHREIGNVIYTDFYTNQRSKNFNYNVFINEYLFQFEKGLTIYGPKLCNLINSFNSFFRDNSFFNDFTEMAFPRLLSKEIMSGFELNSLWPFYLLKVSAYDDTDYRPSICSDAELILDPVQCPWFYKVLSHNKDYIIFPFKVRENLGGWSYRNESKERLSPLEKDIAFLRTEFVFAGKQEDVLTIRCDLIENFCHYLKLLNVPFRLVIGEGCYDSMPIDFFNRLKTSIIFNDLPVIDIEVYLPFKSEWIEISGASYFGCDKVNRFTENPTRIESGCFGVGTSRLALAFLANNGLVESSWTNLFNYE